MNISNSQQTFSHGIYDKQNGILDHISAINSIVEENTAPFYHSQASKKIHELTDLESVMHELSALRQNKGSSKSDILACWDKIILQSFSRIIASAWVPALVEAWVRTVVAVVGQRLYLESAALSTVHGALEAAKHKLGPQHALSQVVPVPLTSLVQEELLHLPDHLLNEGLPALVEFIHSQVLSVLHQCYETQQQHSTSHQQPPRTPNDEANTTTGAPAQNALQRDEQAGTGQHSTTQQADSRAAQHVQQTPQSNVTTTATSRTPPGFVALLRVSTPDILQQLSTMYKKCDITQFPCYAQPHSYKPNPKNAPGPNTPQSQTKYAQTVIQQSDAAAATPPLPRARPPPPAPSLFQLLCPPQAPPIGLATLTLGTGFRLCPEELALFKSVTGQALHVSQCHAFKRSVRTASGEALVSVTAQLVNSMSKREGGESSGRVDVKHPAGRVRRPTMETASLNTAALDPTARQGSVSAQADNKQGDSKEGGGKDGDNKEVAQEPVESVVPSGCSAEVARQGLSDKQQLTDKQEKDSIQQAGPSQGGDTRKEDLPAVGGESGAGREQQARQPVSVVLLKIAPLLVRCAKGCMEERGEWLGWSEKLLNALLHEAYCTI